MIFMTYLNTMTLVRDITRMPFGRTEVPVPKLLHTEAISMKLGVEYVEPSAEDADASKGEASASASASGGDDGVRPNVKTLEKEHRGEDEEWVGV